MDDEWIDEWMDPIIMGFGQLNVGRKWMDGWMDIILVRKCPELLMLVSCFGLFFFDNKNLFKIYLINEQ